ncbi:ankyrin repeat-containing domain protein [Aspergillus alliaceus]|uniref:Ankyrin repeat-containing domain protein n=1 Tax=Petromyces alliaceus TaxID=209559 RepID=A0A5N7BRK3_PETAA|nr:ankyrin repeat-containing domain protein [Aspergillus alliaceus]
MDWSNQEAKIARRRAKNRQAQHRHREATKAKLAELERLRPQVDSKNTFLPSSPYQAACNPNTSVSKTKPSPSRQFCGRCGNDHGGPTYEQSFDLPSLHCHQTNLHNVAAPLRGLNETPSESPPASLDFQDFDFALPTNEENSVLDPHQWYSVGESLPPNTSCDYIGTTASSVHETSRRHRAKSTPQNQPHTRSKSSGQSALHLAAASGNIECVRALLTHNADMNATDALGRTPLHPCAAAGNTADYVSVVQMLIENGANPTLKDRTGMGPLHIAAKRGNDLMLEALIRIGVDVNAL